MAKLSTELCMVINSYCVKQILWFTGEVTLRGNALMNEKMQWCSATAQWERWNWIEQEAGCVVGMWNESRGAARPRHSDVGSWVMGRRRRTMKRKRQEKIVPAEPVKPVMKATLASRGARYSLWWRDRVDETHTQIHTRLNPGDINYDGQQMYQVRVGARDNVGMDIHGKHLLS